MPLQDRLGPTSPLLLLALALVLAARGATLLPAVMTAVNMATRMGMVMGILTPPILGALAGRWLMTGEATLPPFDQESRRLIRPPRALPDRHRARVQAQVHLAGTVGAAVMLVLCRLLMVMVMTRGLHGLLDPTTVAAAVARRTATAEEAATHQRLRGSI